MLFENIVGKRENAGTKHFLHFPQYFQSCQTQKSALELTKIII